MSQSGTMAPFLYVIHSLPCLMKVSFSTLLSALQLVTVPTSYVGATLHRWDTASLSWDGSVVKSWWCNILAENSL